MAEVVQAKIVEVMLHQDNIVYITLENGEQVTPRPGLEKWRVGSQVYKRQGTHTCLDEIEEGETPPQGTFDDLGDYYDFRGDRGCFIIPKRQVTVNADPANFAFLIRKNNKFYILGQGNAEHLQMKAIQNMQGNCAFCQRVEDNPPIRFCECEHLIHEKCIAVYLSAKKMMCCPHFWCKKPFMQNAAKWFIDNLERR